MSLRFAFPHDNDRIAQPPERKHGRNRLAHIAHFVNREDRLVVESGTVIWLRHHFQNVRACNDSEDALDFGGGRGPSFDFRDPWGNRFQVVGYRNIQFERTDGVRRKLGIDGVEKTDAAKAEIADRGLA